ncbi:hypothetical protein [Streptomyces sp. NPDC050856]|uniref:hypothetical protein n=1 Tax=Streptomyces sp. NPDC050856 TaxID=3154939 RepID=UPI0033E0964A
MWDGIELWPRKAGGLLMTGLLLAGHAVAREHWWPPLRVLLLLAGCAAVLGCARQTWQLTRSRESARTALNRLEAAAAGDEETVRR